MRLPLAALALGFVGLGACQSANPFTSPAERHVKSLEYDLENDTIRFELERDAALADVEVLDLWVPHLFDRVLALSAIALSDSVRAVEPETERTREAWLRCRSEFLRMGTIGAEYCVRELSVPGPRASLARELLTQFKPEDCRPAITERLRSANPQSRRDAIRAAEWTNQIPAYENTLVELISDPAWIVRREAALALANSQGSGARAMLIHALDDPQLLVAREAAIALGRRRVRECGDALLHFLERSRKANDPLAIDAALTAFHALSGRKDLGADIAAWRQWVIENRPIVDTRPASEPAKS